MSARDFGYLFLVCLIWGLNFVVTKWVVSGEAGEGYSGSAPFFAAAIRFSLIALALAPLFRRVPEKLGLVLLTGLCMGALHFGLIFVGVQFAPPSTVAVATQLIVPFTALLSVFLLGETIDLARGGGIALALLGVALIAYDPGNFSLTLGVLFVVGGAAAGAMGTVMLKRLPAMGPFEAQGWIAIASAPPLILTTLLFESGHAETLATGGWRLVLAFAFIVGAVAIFGHGTFYALLRRYDASLIAPLTLMAPVWGMIFGVLLTGDQVTLALIVGAGLALAGVGVLAVSTRQRASAMAAPRMDP